MSKWKSPIIGVFVLIAAIVVTSCAGLRTERQKVLTEYPPYVWNRKIVKVEKVGVFPVTVGIRSILNRDLKIILDSLANIMTQYLKEKTDFVILPSIGLPEYDNPDIYIGSPETEEFPGDAESPDITEFKSANPDEGVVVAYYREPSKKWKQEFSKLLQANGLKYGIFLTLQVTSFYPKQKDIVGHKELPLGTEYSQELPWLTALDQPMEVLTITGALLNLNGDAISLAAEGILAQPTKFFFSVIGVTESLTSSKIKQIFSKRRDDVPGKPFIWEAALNNLLANLTGNSKLLMVP